MGYTATPYGSPGNPGCPWVFPLVTSANENRHYFSSDGVRSTPQSGLRHGANDEHSGDCDLSPPAHDILKEITKAKVKEVPEEAFGFPEAGDGKSEKLLASAEFPGDGTGDKETSGRD